MWTNVSGTYHRNMCHQTITLRPNGLTGARLYCDAIQILFRPSQDIGLDEFWPGDDATKMWRVETSQLLLRTRPGFEHRFYAIGGDPGDVQQPVDVNNDVTVKQPTQCAVYSAALSLVPAVEGTEAYWQRTYRPIRDCPVAENLRGVTELDLQLMFPCLLASGGDALHQVPPYRILQVYGEFSLEPYPLDSLLV